MLASAALLVALAAPLSPAAAQMKEASIDDISAALSACAQATSTNGVDAAKLAAAGWVPGRMESKGKEVETPLKFFGKTGNPAMLVATTGANPTCLVTARIASFDSYAATADAISRTLQSQPLQKKGNEIVWSSGGLIVQLDATGTRENPSIRAGVIAVQGEKK